MDPKLKKILRGISLDIRRTLEGRYDEKGQWQAGDLERRLNELGLRRDRAAKPVEELPQLSSEDKAARRLVDGYIRLREEAGVGREAAVAEFVRESAYSWANRLFALRCMEARGVIQDPVILQSESYGGRSLVHNRFAQKNPEACTGNDDGLFAVLFAEFEQRTREIPALFDPKSSAVALRPSIAALKHCIALLSGVETARGQDKANDEVFAAPDAFGWAYQYWNAEEQKRVFEMVRTQKGTKIQGADIVPATQFYTEPYMVKFLVQNSLGALWMGMYPDSRLCEQWDYYVKDADRAPVQRKPVQEITLLDPAQGSGHFHLEAFDLFYAMYEEEAEREGRSLTAREVCASILNRNLYGIDIDGRAVQIAMAALWMRAKERAPDLDAADLTSFHEHLVATNIKLPKERNHLELFLQKHPEDEPLRPALELVFQGLEHADELGSLLQIKEPVDAFLRQLQAQADKDNGTMVQGGLFEPTLTQGTLPVGVEGFDQWKRDVLDRLHSHFEAEAHVAEPVQAFFGESADKSLTFFSVLARHYEVVAANPPYMGSKNMSLATRPYVERYYSEGKRDLYSAFICRARDFLSDGGFMAMVTLSSWLTKDSFLMLRSQLVGSTSLHSFVLLGRYAFSEADPPGLPVLFIVQRKPPVPNQGVKVVTVGRPMDCIGQAALIRKALASPHQAEDESASYKLKQALFAALPGKLILAGLTPQLMRILLEETPLAKALRFCEPATTGNNFRYVRYGWEVAEVNRWFLMSKGGGHRRWKGLEIYRLDWAHDGARIKAEPGSYVRNEDAMFKAGITFTAMSRHGISFREMPLGMTFGKAGPGILRKQEGELGFVAVLNSRTYQFLLRNLSPGASVSLGNVSRLPLPIGVETLAPLESLRLRIAERDVGDELLENGFVAVSPASGTEPTLKASANLKIISHLARSMAALTVEHAIDQKVTTLLALSPQSRLAVRSRFGPHPAELSLLAPFNGQMILERTPATEVSILARAMDYLNGEVTSTDDDNSRAAQIRFQFTDAKCPRNDEVSDDDGVVAESDDADDAQESNSLPPENVLEEIAIKSGVHPASTYLVIVEGILRENWANDSEIKRLTEDRFTVLVLRLLGHRWPKQLEAGEPLPEWADRDGVIPLTNGGETPLSERVRGRMAVDFPDGNVAALEREFEELVGVPLETWLRGPFFERHISQFKKRPIAWQIETEVRSQRSEVRGQKSEGKKKQRSEKASPVFACLIYYHKLDADLLPKIRTQYVGRLRSGYETELRTLERLTSTTAEQQGRKLQLDQWIEELKVLDAKLEQVSLTGFGPTALRHALRQYAINDALLSLTACWLTKLSDRITAGPLTQWQSAAATTKLHTDLPVWIGEAFTQLDHFCGAVGPKPPKQDTFTADPTSAILAPIVCDNAVEIVSKVLDLACGRWWQKFEAIVLTPLKAQLKQDREEQERVKAELDLDEVKRDYERQRQLADRKDELKNQIKSLRKDIETKTDMGKQLRSEIDAWVCPEATTWGGWLGAQPLFDAIASLDGHRQPPATIAEFVAQESAYAPDINDGVRVNIAPVQKAGLLHADVLDSKDADKAISDRAEWRSDERRWVREGKLPRPGWWESGKGTS